MFSFACVGVVCVNISGRAEGVDACQSIMWLLQSSGWKVLIMPLGTVPNPYQIFPVFNMQIMRWTVYCFCALPVLCVFGQTECVCEYLSPYICVKTFFFFFASSKHYIPVKQFQTKCMHICTKKKKKIISRNSSNSNEKQILVIFGLLSLALCGSGPT